jgi:hypothetical protein
VVERLALLFCIQEVLLFDSQPRIQLSKLRFSSVASVKYLERQVVVVVVVVVVLVVAAAAAAVAAATADVSN